MAEGINKSEIVELFLEEVGEHLQALNDGLLALERDSEDTGVVDGIFRSAHTIKGSAAMLGFDVVSKLAHKMEDLLGKIRSQEVKPDESVINLLLQSVDTLSGQVENISHGIEGDKSLIPMFEDLYREFLEGPPAETPEVSQKSAKTAMPLPKGEAQASEEKEEIHESELLEAQVLEEETLQEVPSPPKSPRDLKRAETRKPELKSTPKSLVGAGEKQVVRVNIHDLNMLMNLVGTLVIDRNRLDQYIHHLSKIGVELNTTVGKLLKVIRAFKDKYEFGGPGEWENGGTEAWGDGEVEEWARRSASQPPAPLIPSPSIPPSPHFSPPYLEGFSELEFDKYDDFNILSRSLTEIGEDILETVKQLNNFFVEFEEESSLISRVTKQLEEGITDIRMIPVGTLFNKFHRPVRDASREEGKEAILVTAGEETRLDKTVIEEIADPLMHLVRNAVSHGIEPPAVREKLGKPRLGTISLSAYQEGSYILIKIQDDGGGIDPQKMRETAVKKGVTSQAEVDSLSDEAAIQLIFLPGFSTKEKVTSISGRGVGMDVVKTNISKLNGTIDVKTELGKGTQFLIRLPLTLIIYQALIVRVAGQEFAIPLRDVEETFLINPNTVHVVGREEVIRVRDHILTFARLSKLLRLEEEEASKRKYVPVVILGSTEKRIALMVDELVGQEVIVIKSLGDYLKRVKMFSGATVSGAGKVRLILDISHLIGIIMGQAEAEGPSASQQALPQQIFRVSSELAPPSTGPAQDSEKVDTGQIPVPAPTREKVSAARTPEVLVADDSLSIRKVVSHFLSNAGYQVQVAGDGWDAWTKLNSSHRFDLLITDLEMPKMHGYELIAEVRRKRELKHLPIIVLTSRAGEKHYQKAIDLGANDYLVKPFDDKKLLESVHKLLQK